MNPWIFTDEECRRLAAHHGTPLFAYRASVVRRQYQTLRSVLPERVRVAYAVKANPHPGVLRELAGLGASFDCASGGEMARVHGLNLPPGRCFYAGPGKKEKELSLALDMGVRIQAEGWEDLERLERLASGPVTVNLRIHPMSGVEEGRSIIGGTGPSAFGVDEEDAPALLERARRTLRRVRIGGLHVFAASCQICAGRLLANHASVLALAKRLRDADLLIPSQIDLGGGLGIPYTEGAPPLDTDALGLGLGRLLAEHAWFTGELVLEPGRFLAAPAGLYLTRVIRVKESRGTRFAVLEGGINHLLRPLLTGEPFPVRAVGLESGPTAPVTLAGPLCTSLDRLGTVPLPPGLAPGHLLAVGLCGAYEATEAMSHFLSHPEPPEVWVEGTIPA